MSIYLWTQIFQFLGSLGYLLNNPGTTISSPPPVFGNPAIVPIISIIGSIVGLGCLIGLIILVIAHYELSKYYKEPAIFRNILYSILLLFVVYPIILIIVIGTAVVASIAIGAAIFVGLLVAAIVITIIFVIIYAILWYRAFDKLGEKSGINTFKTAGLLFILGMFIPLLSWVAWILAAQGYKQLKPQQPINNTQTYTPPPTLDKIYCSQCGIENPTNATYCKQCGQTINQPTQTNTTTP